MPAHTEGNLLETMNVILARFRNKLPTLAMFPTQFCTAVCRFLALMSHAINLSLCLRSRSLFDDACKYGIT